MRHCFIRPKAELVRPFRPPSLIQCSGARRVFRHFLIICQVCVCHLFSRTRPQFRLRHMTVVDDCVHMYFARLSLSTT